jgi:hypothetical protein
MKVFSGRKQIPAIFATRTRQGRTITMNLAGGRAQKFAAKDSSPFFLRCARRHPTFSSLRSPSEFLIVSWCLGACRFDHTHNHFSSRGPVKEVVKSEGGNDSLRSQSFASRGNFFPWTEYKVTRKPSLFFHKTKRHFFSQLIPCFTRR